MMRRLVPIDPSLDSRFPRPVIQTKQGAVTFLDVLGWKGIWKQDKQAIFKLQGLVREMTNLAVQTTKQVIGQNLDQSDYRGINIDEATTILSISDTIALFTTGINIQHALYIHAEVCKFAIPESVHRRIPLRGATSFGDYSIQENIMVGPAVDEAASWHEATDWIGVNLTPSAWLKLPGDIPEGWTKYEPPFKKGKWETLCVDWTYEKEGVDIRDVFYEMGPMLPEIANKYTNTLKFLQRQS